MKTSDEKLVPIFQLYGEHKIWPTPDLLHCESIAARSRRHDWCIKPHRHNDLLHILEVRSGSVVLQLEGEEFSFYESVLFVIPSMAIHGFRFSRDVEGSVITLAKPMIEEYSKRLSLDGSLWSEVSMIPVMPGGVETLMVRLIESEYAKPAQERSVCLEGLVQALAVFIFRQKIKQKGAARDFNVRTSDQSETLLQQYQDLVNVRYAEQPTVTELALELGTTGARLNTVCRRLVNKSALQVIHERVVLQAKRELTYTSMTISQISDSLGFSEAPYFTRFFKRETGQTPKTFRRRHPI
ncbi:helix-turn-helix domain-containing protein [Marinobacter sp. ATCH36]|uniref:helix-turn-helix domain-containing protein n=1 Tax=Marinobacter sp. ATCH36 TaxID=2945106 RepID=UPI002021833E|nr:helix-turn-helix domain-containing protein [Marinobacter sp. ATCH36]MCL7942939.1 helix-turn-helix domain-containing protein [Marinobacter sp. ATCH36]